jgi:hypothetical protein
MSSFRQLNQGRGEEADEEPEPGSEADLIDVQTESDVEGREDVDWTPTGEGEDDDDSSTTALLGGLHLDKVGRWQNQID